MPPPPRPNHLIFGPWPKPHHASSGFSKPATEVFEFLPELLYVGKLRWMCSCTVSFGLRTRKVSWWPWFRSQAQQRRGLKRVTGRETSPTSSGILFAAFCPPAGCSVHLPCSPPTKPEIYRHEKPTRAPPIRPRRPRQRSGMLPTASPLRDSSKRATGLGRRGSTSFSSAALTHP
jgi:hypothetical protein